MFSVVRTSTVSLEEFVLTDLVKIHNALEVLHIGR